MGDKDEDFSDMMERETGIIWGDLEKAMGTLMTEKLAEKIIEVKLYVNAKLALEFAKRGDAVFYLRKMLQDGSLWYSHGGHWTWTPLHALYMLALVKTPEALRLALETIRFRGHDLSDSLTEDMTGLLASLGAGAIEELVKFIQDETLEPFVRGSASTALGIIAKKAPSRGGEIKASLLGVFNSTGDPIFAGCLVDDMSSFGDSSLKDTILKAYEDGRVDLLSRDDIEDFFENPGHYKESMEMLDKGPMSHFSRENIELLEALDKRDSEGDKSGGKKKIGRNAPCPCGSGKKYKKCCLKG